MGSEAGRFPTDFNASEMEILDEGVPGELAKADYDLSCNSEGCTLTVVTSTYSTGWSLFIALGISLDKTGQSYGQYRIFRDDGGKTWAIAEADGRWSGAVDLSSGHPLNMTLLVTITKALLDMEHAGESSREVSDLRQYLYNIAGGCQIYDNISITSLIQELTTFKKDR